MYLNFSEIVCIYRLRLHKCINSIYCFITALVGLLGLMIFSPLSSIACLFVLLSLFAKKISHSHFGEREHQLRSTALDERGDEKLL